MAVGETGAANRRPQRTTAAVVDTPLSALSVTAAAPIALMRAALSCFRPTRFECRVSSRQQSPARRSLPTAARSSSPRSICEPAQHIPRISKVVQRRQEKRGKEIAAECRAPRKLGATVSPTCEEPKGADDSLRHSSSKLVWRTPFQKRSNRRVGGARSRPMVSPTACAQRGHARRARRSPQSR